MNVRALGGRFNCLIGPEFYYTQVLVWISMSRLYKYFIVLFGHGRQLQFVFDASNTLSEFWVPARGITYTNITYNVIPLSLSKYTLFFKGEDHLFLQPVHLRSKRTIIT